MVELCKWGVVHWVRYPSPITNAETSITQAPKGCAAWKFGPDSPPGVRPDRADSDIWCGIAAFRERADAQQAYEHPEHHVSGLSEAREAWHSLLLPIAQHGESNHLEPQTPGPLFQAAEEDPGGTLLVMTTAGFDLRVKSDFLRLFDFRRRVHATRDVVGSAKGSLAHQVFAPTNARDDGVTMSIWADDSSMAAFAYGPGPHRSEVDRQSQIKIADRSSFTRFRVLASKGTWNGDHTLGQPNV